MLITGCLPSAQNRGDEEKEPHFMVGKSRASTLDYEGAIESFDKALEVNPHSAAAHLELACLFDQKVADPAAAIYHYQKYLKLRPEAGNADVVNQRIMVCKTELARNVSLGPLTEKQQRELEQVTEDNKKLAGQVKQLTEELDKWRAYAARIQILTNSAVSGNMAPRPAVMLASSTGVTPNASAGSSAPLKSAGSVPSATNRTHIIKAGETAILIARKYGVKSDALLAANPGVDPKRLRVGQSLVIP